VTDALHILVIDDDDIDRMAVRRALKSAEMTTEVSEAADGTSAIDLLHKHRFDCVLLDHHLPDRDGLTVLRQIRSAGITTPIIMMTGQGNEELAVDMMKAGATDYLAKSRVSLDHLFQSIRSAVRLHEAEGMAREATAKLQQQVHVTETLYRIGGMLAAERDVHKLVQTVTDSATKLVRAEFGAFFYNLINEQGESYTLFTLSGVPREAFEKFPMPRNTEIFAPTFSGSGVVRLDDVTKDPRYGKNEPHFGMPKGHLPVRSYLAVPVTSRTTQVLGGLFFGHSQAGKFTDADEALVLGIASQAAVAIDNAQLYEALRRGEEQYRFLAESIPQMVWTADTAGRVDYYNRRFIEFSGLSLEELLGEGWRLLVHPEDLERTARRWTQSLESGTPYDIEYRLRTKDGRTRWFLGRAMPMRDTTGKIVKWFGTCTDIDDQKRAEAELVESRDAAEAANNAKDQFLAVLSHELRTPLMPVLTTTAELELERSLPEHVKSGLKVIRRNVEMEARLIDDLLDLTRVAKGKLQLNFESSDVYHALHTALDICRPEIEAKGINVAMDLTEGVCPVRADPARLQQVFWNLISNAVKFTPEGGTITFRCRPSPAGRVRLEVSDTGMGIEPQALPRIFDAFEQGGQSVARIFGGLGLGLAITKALVTLHGGTISAHSEGKDRGATFFVELPLFVETAATRPSCDQPPTAPTLKLESRDIRILLVDDHEDTNRAMGRLLRRLGYNVQTAGSVQDALSAAESDPPFDLLISDIGLPDGSGLQLMEELLKRRPIKGIALSGFGMEEDVKKSKEAGFYEHLTKPINFKRLETAIKQLTTE
jgi:PAS domain S-box-containing protein